jgi:excisionase family DNA binding protein
MSPPRIREPIERPEVMTLLDVAEYLHCHPTTIYRLVHSGGLPTFRLGGGWRVMRENLDKWIASVGGRPLASAPEDATRGRKVEGTMKKGRGRPPGRKEPPHAAAPEKPKR